MGEGMQTADGMRREKEGGNKATYACLLGFRHITSEWLRALSSNPKISSHLRRKPQPCFSFGLTNVENLAPLKWKYNMAWKRFPQLMLKGHVGTIRDVTISDEYVDRISVRCRIPFILRNTFCFLNDSLVLFFFFFLRQSYFKDKSDAYTLQYAYILHPLTWSAMRPDKFPSKKTFWGPFWVGRFVPLAAWFSLALWWVFICTQKAFKCL